MPLGVFGNSPKRYVTEQLKSIVTSPANIRRLIFFDKNDSSTTLEDMSSNGQNATLSLAASSLDPQTAGKARVLNFNASGDYWEFADADDLSFGNGLTDSAFSIVACLNMNRVTGDSVIQKYDATTGNTQTEYAIRFVTGKLYASLFDDSTGGTIGRYYNTSLSGDIGVYHNYFITYSGSSLSSGIKIYRDDTRIDDTNNNSGSYTAMENKNAKVASYFTLASGTKSYIASSKNALIAIIAEELSQTQITQINTLLKKYMGVI